MSCFLGRTHKCIKVDMPASLSTFGAFTVADVGMLKWQLHVIVVSWCDLECCSWTAKADHSDSRAHPYLIISAWAVLLGVHFCGHVCRKQGQRQNLDRRKLPLILDLDHTLLNSTTFNEVTCPAFLNLAKVLQRLLSLLVQLFLTGILPVERSMDAHFGPWKSQLSLLGGGSSPAPAFSGLYKSSSSVARHTGSRGI